MISTPINILRWCEENKDILLPPINNKCLQMGNDFFVMVVGGPNHRSDFHVNKTEEWFYQVKGDLLLRTADDSMDGVTTIKDIWIREGEVYLHPGGIPHSPIRFADTIGLVIERRRAESDTDLVKWYCQRCSFLLHEKSFYCKDIEVQLADIVSNYASNIHLRTCQRCHYLNPPTYSPNTERTIGNDPPLV